MTWRSYVAAKRLLYEEHIGVYARARDNEKSAEYQKSVAALKRYESPASE